MDCNSGACSSARTPAGNCRCRCNGSGHGSGASRGPRPASGGYRGGSRTQSHEGVARAPSETNDAVLAYVRAVRPGEESAEAVSRHRRSIQQAIEAAGLDIVEVRQVGSHSRGTAVDGSSDADYMVVLRRNEMYWGEGTKNSNTVLAKVRLALQDRFHNTASGKDGQAIVVDFGDGPVDVVVAFYDGPAPGSGHPTYAMADGDGDYMHTSPGAQAKHFREADQATGGRLRDTVRAVKAFRERTEGGVPLKGIYVETVLANAGVGKTVGQPTTHLLRDAFHALHESGCAPVDDPTGVGDPIHASRTPAQRERAAASIAAASDRADRAVEAETRGDHKEARRLWGLVFGQEI